MASDSILGLRKVKTSLREPINDSFTVTTRRTKKWYVLVKTTMYKISMLQGCHQAHFCRWRVQPNLLRLQKNSGLYKIDLTPLDSDPNATLSLDLVSENSTVNLTDFAFHPGTASFMESIIIQETPRICDRWKRNDFRNRRCRSVRNLWCWILWRRWLLLRITKFRCNFGWWS